MEGRKKIFGKWGEDMAVKFLLRRGFAVLERNFFTTVGEIDIIAKKGDDYYFVEVKTRVDNDLATDLSITPTKLFRLKKTIKCYCYRRGIGEDVGLVPSGLIIAVDKQRKTVKFRFFPIIDI